MLIEEIRSSFEIFKSNTCHYVKDMGDLDFIETVLKSDEIQKLYNKRWYPEALYVLAMLDYLSRINEIPLCACRRHSGSRRIINCNRRIPVYKAHTITPLRNRHPKARVKIESQAFNRCLHCWHLRRIEGHIWFFFRCFIFHGAASSESLSPGQALDLVTFLGVLVIPFECRHLFVLLTAPCPRPERGHYPRTSRC